MDEYLGIFLKSKLAKRKSGLPAYYEKLDIIKLNQHLTVMLTLILVAV